MKTFIPTIVGLSIGLVSLAVIPEYAGGGRGGGGHGGFSGGGHAGFGGGARGTGMTRGYSGAGISRPAGTYCRGPIHLESQPDGMAAMAGTVKGTTRREHRLERGFMVQLLGRKPGPGPLPGNLLVRQIIPVATMSREINPALALRERPISNRVIIREQIGICASNAPAQRKGMPRRLTTRGQSRI